MSKNQTIFNYLADDFSKKLICKSYFSDFHQEIQLQIKYRTAFRID